MREGRCNSWRSHTCHPLLWEPFPQHHGGFSVLFSRKESENGKGKERTDNGSGNGSGNESGNGSGASGSANGSGNGSATRSGSGGKKSGNGSGNE